MGYWPRVVIKEQSRCSDKSQLGNERAAFTRANLDRATLFLSFYGILLLYTLIYIYICIYKSVAEYKSAGVKIKPDY